MRNSIKNGVIFFTFLSTGLVTANAAITYTIDADNSLLILNGSASGEPGSVGVYNEIRWGADELNNDADVAQTDIDQNGNITVKFEAYHGFGFDHVLLSVSSLFDSLRTLTFDNLVIDYSAFSTSSKDFINSLAINKAPLELSLGNGYGDITYAAVPEASHIALAIAAGALALPVGRRVLRSRKARA